MTAKRIALAVIAPDVSLSAWARFFRRAITPTVDEVRIIAGSPLEEMRRLVLTELGGGHVERWDVQIRDRYPNHGQALTELYRGIEGEADAVVVESDCFITCKPGFIDAIWHRLSESDGIIGSRMARPMDAVDNRPAPGVPQFLDTFGDGLYPNMAFCRMSTLRRHTTMDWSSRGGGDVGQVVGEELHRAGIHLREKDHLPQCRLSMYAGTRMVDPETWAGPWLHVGEMSGIPRWGVGHPPPPRQGGHFEAVAAFAAALESGLCKPGLELERMAGHIEWAERQDQYRRSERYSSCKRLLKRIFASVG